MRRNFKIRIGKTRVVIIFGKYVYKIIRLRLFDFIIKWIKLEYERKKFGDFIAFKNMRRHTRSQLAKDMFYACFLANYREYNCWKESLDSTKYVPTLFTFFYFFNIQEREDVKRDYSDKIISLAHNRKCAYYPPTDESRHLDNLSLSGRILDYGR
jgi:hypothetical protein